MGIGSLLKRTAQEENMIGRYITPGDKLEMRSVEEVTLPDGTQGIRTYQSEVFDIGQDGKVMLAMPMDKTKLVLLPVDGEYDVCFFSKAGMVQANVRILDRQKLQNNYVLVTEVISDLRKYQRREYYRFNCVLESGIRVISKEEAETICKGLEHLVSDTNMNPGIVVDISGGGLRVVSKQEYQTGDLVYMRFRLPIEDKKRTFRMAARVVSSKEMPRKNGEYETRVKFLAIDATTREEIIKYIFDEERKIRKNGKG
ncbi:MAG: flagellar brake protein [Lachnospiraceae bacterium]|nr:flagellar brake protein [Lachnospiraceae bacterium]